MDLCRVTIENNASASKKWFPPHSLSSANWSLRATATRCGNTWESPRQLALLYVRAMHYLRSLSRNHCFQTCPPRWNSLTYNRTTACRSASVEYISGSSHDCTSMPVKRWSRSIWHEPWVERSEQKAQLAVPVPTANTQTTLLTLNFFF